MKKQAQPIVFVGGILILCAALYCGFSCYRWYLLSHYLLSSHDAMQTAGYLAATRGLAVLRVLFLGGLGTFAPLLALSVPLWIFGVKKTWQAVLGASLCSLALVVLTERLSRLFLEASFVRSPYFYAVFALALCGLFFFLFCATLFRYACSALWNKPLTENRLTRRDFKAVFTAISLYALWFLVLCTLLLLTFRLFTALTGQGLRPDDHALYALVKGLSVSMTEIVSATGPRLLLPLSVMLYLTAKHGMAAAALSWAGMTAASYGVCYAFYAAAHALGSAAPGKANYTSFLLPCAISLFCALCLSLLLCFAAAAVKKRVLSRNT